MSVGASGRLWARCPFGRLMDWWVGALAFVLIVIGVTETLHALEIIGDPMAAMLAFFLQLRRLLPW
jgi:hypothetical protein